MELQSDDIARVLVLVQTDPTISHKYTETVCTAGFRDLGDSHYQWIRLYPIVKRAMDEKYNYVKYQWIQCRLRDDEPNMDKRPESHKVHLYTIQPQDPVSTGTNRDWAERRRIILESGIPCYTNKDYIRTLAANNTESLCVFKPSRIAKFYAVQQDPYTDEDLAIIEKAKNEKLLVSPEYNFKDVRFERLPYYFKCQFYDDDGKEMNLSVLDWEISTLLRKQIRKFHNDVEKAKLSTLNKYNGFISKNDVYFILGTRLKAHNKLRANPDSNENPWSIISVIPFPKNQQKLLL